MSIIYSPLSVGVPSLGGMQDREKCENTKSISDISSGQLRNIIKKIPQKIGEIQDIFGQKYKTVDADFSEIETPRGKGNRPTKELLNDCHETLPLLNNSLTQAMEIAKSGGTISVEVHKSDIKNKKFLGMLKAIKEAGVSTINITLELFSKKNEIYDSQIIQQLKGATELGFRFGMYDFMEKDDGEIQTDNLITVIKEKMLPRYIKIAGETLNKIKTGVNRKISALYNNLIKTGVKIIEITPEKENPEIKAKYTKEAKEIIENASIEGEGIYRLDGIKYGSELLIRFSDGLNTIDGLDQLKLSDTTGLLMQKNIETAANIIKNMGARTFLIKNMGTRTFLNVYVKDLGQPGFREVIMSIIKSIHQNDRKKIIFEILEDRYGYMDDLVIANIRFLQEIGCSIAIDDLCIDDDNTGMSLENLETLHENGIYPEYIKIDGKHIEAIQKGTLSEITIKRFKEVIGVFSVLQKPPIFIAEWIQDTEHALLIKKTLGTSRSEFLYQGKNIQNGKFGLK